MNSKTLTEAQKVLDLSLKETEGHSGEIQVYDPMLEADKALAGFFHNRLLDLQKDAQFKEDVMSAISARLPEYNPAQLNDLIGIVMPNVTMGSDKVLSPLLEQQRALRAKDGGVEEEIFSKSPKEMLSAFEELFTFVEAIRKVKGDTEEKKAEDIKTILAESIKEKSE